MKRRQTVVTLLFALFCTAGFAADRKYIHDPKPANAKGLPFSDGVLVGDTLYVAGHIGLDPKTGKAPGDAQLEAKMVMDGIKETVENAGLTMDDLVSVQVFCTDLKLYDTFNAVYQTYFHGDYPARAFVGAESLLRGGHYEVLGIAIKKAN